jgi:hypothetical protein
VIEPLRELLAELRTLEGNPAAGPILRGVSGKPLSLDMMAREVIIPAVRNPENYSSVSRDPMAAKGLLRHTSVNTTLTHYIKDVPEVTANAMTLVKELFAKPLSPDVVQ